MTSTTQPKKGRGKRMANQYPDKDTCYVITRVGEEGQILEPREYISRWRNAIGAKVRDQLNPAIRFWTSKQGVPLQDKNKIWEKWLMVNFRLPEGKHELVRKHTYKIMGHAFQRWRSDLNRRFIQRGLTPFHECRQNLVDSLPRVMPKVVDCQQTGVQATNEMVIQNNTRVYLGSCRRVGVIPYVLLCFVIVVSNNVLQARLL
jgi:hypothetical protein